MMPKDARFGLAAGILLLVVILVVFCRKPAAPTTKIGKGQQSVSAASQRVKEVMRP